MRKAMIFAQEIGLQKCHFEGDLETIIKALKIGDMSSSPFGHLVRDILAIVNSFLDFSFFHIVRQGNAVAHTLTLRLSTLPVYPSNPPEPEPKIARTDTPTVGDGSPPTELDAFGLVGGFPLPKPEQPDPIINLETSDDIQRSFNENIQNPMIFEVIRQKFIENRSNQARSRRDLV